VKNGGARGGDDDAFDLVAIRMISGVLSEKELSRVRTRT
jgi:hypothetical protein